MTKLTPGQSTVESHRTDFEEMIEKYRTTLVGVGVGTRSWWAKTILDKFLEVCDDPMYSRGVIGEIAGLLKEAGVTG